MFSYYLVFNIYLSHVLFATLDNSEMFSYYLVFIIYLGLSHVCYLLNKR